MCMVFCYLFTPIPCMNRENTAEQLPYAPGNKKGTPSSKENKFSKQPVIAWAVYLRLRGVCGRSIYQHDVSEIRGSLLLGAFLH